MRHLLQNPIDVSETARLEYIYEATTSARLDLIMRQQGGAVVAAGKEGVNRRDVYGFERTR